MYIYLLKYHVCLFSYRFKINPLIHFIVSLFSCSFLLCLQIRFAFFWVGVVFHFCIRSLFAQFLRSNCESHYPFCILEMVDWEIFRPSMKVVKKMESKWIPRFNICFPIFEKMLKKREDEPNKTIRGHGMESFRKKSMTEVYGYLSSHTVWCGGKEIEARL